MTAARFIGYMYYADNGSLTETACEAIAHYTRVYGHPPSVVYINPKHPLEGLEFDEVRVEHSAYVLPNNCYVGEPA